eukprot:748485-Hanusia_phi.AAC.2
MPLHLSACRVCSIGKDGGDSETPAPAPLVLGREIPEWPCQIVAPASSQAPEVPRCEQQEEEEETEAGGEIEEDEEVVGMSWRMSEENHWGGLLTIFVSVTFSQERRGSLQERGERIGDRGR